MRVTRSRWKHHPGFSHEYDFLVPNIRPESMLLVARRAVSTDCWCCCASLALVSTTFLESFLDIDFLSKLGGRSPSGVPGVDPARSAESDRLPVPSPRMALLLRLVRFDARLRSCVDSRLKTPRYLSATGFPLDVSDSGWGPKNVGINKRRQTDGYRWYTHAWTEWLHSRRSAAKAAQHPATLEEQPHANVLDGCVQETKNNQPPLSVSLHMKET